MKCKMCGHEVSAVQKFCGNCGATVSQEKTCNICATSNPAAAQYCSSCGTGLTTTEKSPAQCQAFAPDVVQAKQSMGDQPPPIAPGVIAHSTFDNNNYDLSHKASGQYLSGHFSRKSAVIIAASVFGIITTTVVSVAFTINPGLSPAEILTNRNTSKSDSNLKSGNSNRQMPESVQLDYGQQLARGAEMAMSSGPICDSYKQMIRSFANPAVPENVRVLQIEKIIDIAERAGCIR